MTLGQRISLYRKKLHISQEELGARLGVSRQAVSKWETDLSAPDLNNLIGLARELGVSVAELTETPEEPVPPKNTSNKVTAITIAAAAKSGTPNKPAIRCSAVSVLATMLKKIPAQALKVARHPAGLP